MMCYGGDVGIFSIGEFVNVRRRCGVLHRSAIVPTRFCGFGAGRARSNSEVFFFAAEIAAAKMLLFFRKPATMDILTKRGSADSGLTGGFIGRILVKPKSAHLFNSAPGST